MESSRTLRFAVLPTVGVLVIAGLLASLGGGVLGGGTPASPLPSQSPTPNAPTTPQPTVDPSTPPAVPSVVQLDDGLGHDVSVVIDDSGDVLSGAVTGHPAVGMSVRWSDIKAEQVDARTIRLTWAGYPRDETVRMDVSRAGDRRVIRIAQTQPYPNTDAMGQDRVLLLTFPEAVDAADLDVTVRDSTAS